MLRWYNILALTSLLAAVGCQKDYVLEPSLPSTGEVVTLSIESFTDEEIGTTRAESSEITIHRGYIFFYDSAGTYEGHKSISELANFTQDGSKVSFEATNFSSTDMIIAIFNHDTSAVPEDLTAVSPSTIGECFPISAEYLAMVESEMNLGSYSLGMPMFVNDFTDSDRTIREAYRSLARIELFIKSGLTIDHESHTHSISASNLEYMIVNDISASSVGHGASRYFEEEDCYDFESFKETDDTAFPYSLTSYTTTTTDSSSSNKVYLHSFPYSTTAINGDEFDKSDYSSDRFTIILRHGDKNVYTEQEEALYYKLNLLDKATSTYFDVEPNHSYRVVITAVNSRGYDTLEEAYLMPPSNIEYEIYDDKGGLTSSNGQYAISMDEALSYDEILVYGSYDTTLEFNNIRYVLPDGGQMDDSEFITNEVTFSVIESTGLTYSITTDFDFDDGVSSLSNEGQSIAITLSGEGECTITLKIKLGNLDLGRDEISIKKVATNGDGDGSFDAHPGQLEIPGQQFVVGSWQSDDVDFGARESSSAYDDQDGGVVIYMGENATPTGYRTMDGYVSGESAINSYPVFSPKTRKGYYSYINDEDETRKVMIQLEQLAPFYLGHFGSTASDESLYHYNGLICEKIEEVPVIDINNNNTITSYVNGLMSWSEKDKVYYTGTIWGDYLGLGERYLNLVEGRAITENIVVNNTTSGYLPTAALYCYMKNDVNGNGVIEDNEPIVWYLPAQNQALAMWINMNVFDEDDGLYRLNNRTTGDTRTYYWTCSEADPTEYDGDDPDDDWDYIYIPNVFTEKVLSFNMLEGQSDYSGKDDSWDQNHVRCVRGLD